MNFNYTEDQLAIKDVADKIFSDLGDDAVIRACFEQDKPFHKELWEQLAQNGLLAATLPGAYGGSELGMTEMCLIIEAQGRAVAPIPLIETVVECAMPIEKFASDDLKGRLLNGVASGEIILSAVRAYNGLQDKPELTATADGDGFVLNGDSSLVSYAPLANGYLVTCAQENGDNVVLYCEANAEGISATEQRSVSMELASHLSFSNVKVNAEEVVATGAQADELIEYQAQRTYTAMAAQQTGLLREGLNRAAQYTNERKQFGRPLGAFQAVAQQAGDAYMAIEALRGVYWRALDDIDKGADAAMSSRVAKFWICEAGHVAAHIVMHIHGGIAQDLEYPVHRFFIWAKKNEHYLGAINKQEQALGELIRQNPEAVA